MEIKKSLNEMKKIVLVLLAVLSFLSPISVRAQSTLTLQEKCSEGALTYVNRIGIEVKFTCAYHYNKKLDKCFVKIIYLENLLR